MQAKRLFYVAAIATTLVGVSLVLDGVVSSSRRHKLKPLNNFNSSIHDDFEKFSFDKGQPIHHAIDVVSFYKEDQVQNNTCNKEKRVMEQQETPPQQQPIDAGDLAELYWPHSHHTTPVIVNSWESDGKGGTVYSLIHADTRQEIPSMVDSSHVHR